MGRAVAGTALAAVLGGLGAGCAGQSGTGGPDGVPGSGPGTATVPGTATASRTAGTTSAGGGAAGDRVVYFSTTPKSPTDGHQVLHDRAEADGYAARLAGRDPQAQAQIAAAARATDFTRQVLVGWTATTGCSAATSAALTVSGDRVALQVSQPKPPPECVMAFRVSVVFQVAKERMPARPVFG
ncbi:hypothetical protein [Actinacidiphila bryophytorum]|uniref:hypothetical protein n=1 Tax=Actinacidiphila bryophytorum TaxID=1436133 RepID=UPI002176C28B|nr:hypothetical protein [Actinacidiphila bryophytorum]UWE08336.1 hypothetical protein NYE86_06095 [Actinacidiphila bryophytorum]